ncbi:MAG: thymidylate synthase [candidate division NC10 bacterium]|nr:thymidylate synthase [candidate division NC10 bacterium]
MKTPGKSNVDDHDEMVGTPVIFVSEKSIPSAIYAAMRQVLARGYAIRTQYDRKDPEGNYIDPPSLDVSSAIQIINPYAQPRFPKSSCVEIGKYIAETCWGVKDHLVLDQEELMEKLAKGEFDERTETHWPYTYHQRLFAYPASNGKRINQVQKMLERLAEEPITRRATAITFVPEIDQFIKGDLPCLQRISLRCTEDETGRLHLHMNTHWRSRDLFNAAADNIIAMTFWQREWAAELSQMMGRDVVVGQYKDFADSLHIYGQVLRSMDVEKMVGKWNALPEEEKGYTSEDARDLLVMPDLEKLLAEDPQWHFPQESKDKIVSEMERMRRGEYLP